MNKLLLISSLFLTLLVACTPQKSTKLTIATASNMQFAIKELSSRFTQQSGIECETIISSSGKLTAQIKSGAPYDVFLSADMKYPKELHQEGWTNAPPFTYAKGLLVLWTMDDSIKPSLDVLQEKAIRHIAIANPKTAPYGAAALQVIQPLDWQGKIESKLVFGESIAQSNQFIQTQSAQIGFTAKSVVLSPRVQGKGKWIAIDSTLYTPILQAGVLLKSKNNRAQAAQKFQEFLLSKEAKEILTTFGYVVN